MIGDYQPTMPSMTIYVPRSGAVGPAHIAPASAIVGVEQEGGVLCYYEGEVHSQQRRRSYEQNLTIACGRLSERAATTAFALFPKADVVPVGTAEWDPVLYGWIVKEVTDAEPLIAWAGALPRVCGTADQRSRACVLHVSRDRGAMLAYQAAQSRGMDPIAAVLARARTKARS